MLKRKFTALLEVPTLISFDVEIEWDEEGEPSKLEIIEAYEIGNSRFTFKECEREEDTSNADVSDIEEDESEQTENKPSFEIFLMTDNSGEVYAAKLKDGHLFAISRPLHYSEFDAALENKIDFQWNDANFPRNLELRHVEK